jgi:3-hydroxyacyl-[acyl-carrier-protein] dehydratase
MNPMREQIRSLLSVATHENGFRAVLTVDPKLTVFPDHFPGFPVLPGICLMQAVVLAGAIRAGVADLRVCTLKNAKLMQPALPGDQIVIEAEMAPGADGDFRIKARLFNGDKRCAEFSLVAGLATAEGAAPT